MICPQCQTELPDDARFCNECGRKLESVCSECGKGNPPTSKFCLECGHDLRTPPAASPLKDLSFDEKLANIQKYLPSGLTEKVLSQRGRIEGERRQVTIMFVDMKGFTPLTEKLGPEETFTLMDQVFELMIHKVHDYEGTVNELRGDGMLAFFGAPIALEDAPQRAIRSSLAIHREMTKFSDKLKDRTDIPPVQLRIGINTGPVVVGTLGNDLRVQFTAVGDTINMAARMEQLAEPGTTYVTEDAFKITEGYFRFEALGEKEVKGKEQPIKVYRVLAASTRRTRFDVDAERGLTRFIGRERELELLMDAFERAKSGRGQAVSIMGEAGVGKSRLLYEFRKAISNEDVTFLEGKCLSYGKDLAYHPIIDILKANFGIEGGDTDSEITAKVRRGLTLLGADEASTLPYLLELLSVEDSGVGEMSMSPEAAKDRIIGALQRIILKGSEIRPSIFAFEDLHWTDKTSEEASKYLLESIPGSRVLMIFTYRPEFVHTWGGKSYHSQISLNRLSNRESLALVTQLLGSREIHSDLEEFILQKTEGIPLFIEEFVRSFRDMKIIRLTNEKYHLAEDVDQVGIPSTIQDVILARVDGLPEGAKELLQTGSVIEREFSYELIKHVTGLQEHQLLNRLAVLKDSELVYERGVYPHSTYIFKHALTREVVYDSILTRRRKELHEKIGGAIEELCAETLSENYGILSEHYLTAENFEKGAHYCGFAGQRATRIGSFHDAIMYADKRIACLEKLPQTHDVLRRIINMRSILGLLYAQTNYVVEAKQAIDPIMALGENIGHDQALPRIHVIMGIYRGWVEEDFQDALQHFQQATSISESKNDPASMLHATYWSGLFLFFICDFDNGLEHLKNVLGEYLVSNNIWGESAVRSVTSIFGHYFQGALDQAHKASEEATRVAEESGAAYSKCRAYISRGISCFGKGDFPQAREHLSMGIHFCEKIDAFFWDAFARIFLGEICFENGEYESAENHHEKAIWLLKQIKGGPSWANFNRIALNLAKVMIHANGVHPESLYDYASGIKAKIFEGWASRYVAKILLNIDDKHMSEAQDWLEKAIAADRRNGMTFHVGRDFALHSELCKKQGDQAKAKDNLRKAIEIYKACGADGWVSRAERKLADFA